MTECFRISAKDFLKLKKKNVKIFIENRKNHSTYDFVLILVRYVVENDAQLLDV